MLAESQVKRGSRKPPTNSRRQGAFTFKACGDTAGGSGTASMEAATINTLNTTTTYETDFIPYGAHCSESNRRPVTVKRHEAGTRHAGWVSSEAPFAGS